MTGRPERKYFIIVAAFAAFGALFWRRLFFTGLVPFDFDTLAFYLPNWTIGRRLLETGSLLWDPYRNFGQPFLAVPPAQALYPLRFLSPLVNFAGFVQLTVAFHTALAAVFAWLLARRRGASDAGASVTALAFAFAGPFFMRVVFLADFAAMAWLPCTLYLLDSRRPVWLAGALALQWVAGFPPVMIVCGFVLAAYAHSVEDRRSAWRTLAVAVPLSAGLAAVQVIPFLEMLRQSIRDVLVVSTDAMRNSTHPVDLVRGLLLPSFLHDVFPRPLYYLPMFYLGPLVTALAIAGAFLGRARDRWLLGFAAGFFFLAMGQFNFVSPHLPVLRVFQSQGTWVIGGTACLAVLASRGLSRFRPRLQWTVAGLVALDLLVFAWPLRHSAGESGFFNEIDARLPGFDRKPEGRVIHAEPVMARYPDWDWDAPGAWPLLKAILLPSYGTVFGLREGASHHSMTSRRALAFRERLNYGSDVSRLLDVADIERVITATPAGVASSLPGIQDFSVVANDDRPGRAFVLDRSTRPARIEVDRPGVLVAAAAGPGTFIFSEGFFPGWRAVVDGNRVETEPYEDAFLSVRLPEGEHRVEMAYRPLSAYLGLVVTLLSLGWTGFLAARRRQ